MNRRIKKLIDEINVTDKVCVRSIVSAFEKKIKKNINKYIDKRGLEDYILKSVDYIILYYIWKNCNRSIYIEDILIIMYSFYKLEEFYFDNNLFDLKNSFDILNNSNINYLIINSLYIINE
tara:strand:+ start:5045 stop:5407 length:363 start_codon:yes stop_codon:yes gene_type:complete